MKTVVGIIALLAFFIAIVGAQPAPAPGKTAEVKTGGVKMITIDGKYNVWTKKVGNGKIKVLLLHGGPGATHEYFECFEDFLPKEGIEFYYYDQLGSAYSDQPADSSLWNIPRFVEEVEQVRKGLGLDNFYLYGQSWGGLLAMEYALKYQQHLKGLVVSNMTASAESYKNYTAQLRAKLPADVIKQMDQFESQGKYDAPEYQGLLFQNVYAQYICRLDPWPEPLMRSFKHLNPAVYGAIQGPNEFTIVGAMADWNAWDRIKNITVPTFLIGAKYDEMNPDDIKKEGTLIPHSRVLITNGSHMSMYDDQQTYFKGLVKFLKDVDQKKFK